MPFSIYDILGIEPGGGTVDQVMRDAKAPRLPGPGMLPGVAENIGDVGDRPGIRPGSPPPEQATMRNLEQEEAGFDPSLPDFAALTPPAALTSPGNPQMDAEALAEPQLPMPLEMSQQPSGGGLPVQPTSGAAAVPPVAAPSAQAQQPTAFQQFRQRQREMSMAVAQKMMTGSPAMRVQGLQLLFSVQKDFQDEAAEQQKKIDEQNERKRQEITIDASVADDTDKDRAKTLVGLGARPQDVTEALRFNNAGATERKERREQFTKWGSQVSTAARDLGTIGVQAQKAMKIMDESIATTGTPAWFAQLVPGSAANKLNNALEPIRALVGYGYLQEMREASKTGGAIGNVTENETKWLMGIQGSLDPVTNTIPDMKENIVTILEGKRIALEMRKLAPAIDAGDPAAWEKYSALTQQLAENGETIRARMRADPRAVPVQAESSFEKQYGGR